MISSCAILLVNPISMQYLSPTDIAHLSDQEKLCHFQKTFQQLDACTHSILEGVSQNLSAYERPNLLRLIKNLLPAMDNNLKNVWPTFEDLQITYCLEKIQPVLDLLQSLRYQRIEQGVVLHSPQGQSFAQQIDVLRTKIHAIFQQANRYLELKAHNLIPNH